MAKLASASKTFKLSLALLILPILSGCVTKRAGEALLGKPVPQGTVLFHGLLDKQATENTHYVFITHGMGPTEENFGDILLSRLVEAKFTPEKSWPGADGGWLPAELPVAVDVRDDVLPCKAGDTSPPCHYENFGGYKIDKFVNADRSQTVYVYRYFWDGSLRSIQKPFLANDDAVDRSWLATKLKPPLVNYGFSDAAAYLGPLGPVMRAGMETVICSMMKHAQAGGPPDKPAGACQFSNVTPTGSISSAKFSFISQSLGSRILFDTLLPAYESSLDCSKWDTSARAAILGRTDTFFLLANQLPLLRLGQLSVTPSSENRHGCVMTLKSALSRRSPSFRWRQTPMLQMVSFNDPEDLLGFRLTNDLLGNQSPTLKVIEVLHRNTPVRSFAGKTFSLPMQAHAVELERDSSAKMIMCGAFSDDGARVLASDCVFTQPN